MGPSRKKISADLFFATFGEVLQKVVGYIVLIVLARQLDKDSMGQFFVASTIAMIAAAATELGTGRHLIRAIATSPQDALRNLGDVLSLRIPLTLCALLLVNTVVYIMDPALAGVMLLTSCYALVGDLYFSYSAFFVGRRLVTLRLLTIVAGQLLLALCVGMGLVLGGSLYAVLLGYIAANIITLAGTAMLVHRRFGSVQLFSGKGRAWALVRAAAPFGALTALGLLHSKADTLMLYALSSSAAVASYESVYKLLEVSRLIVRPAVTVFFPIYAGLAARGEWAGFQRAYSRLLVWGGGAGALMSLTVMAVAGVAVPLIWGSPYRDAIPILRILCLGIPALYLGTLALFIAGSLHLERTAVYLAVAALVANVAVNAIAIPRWGALGAAIATVATESALTASLLYLIHRRLRPVVRLDPGLSPDGAAADIAAA
jgi:O-antigen/teichoic acid export membrane protein